MRCTPIVTGLVLSSIVFATASAQAQVTLDLSKITCDQYVHAVNCSVFGARAL